MTHCKAVVFNKEGLSSSIINYTTHASKGHARIDIQVIMIVFAGRTTMQKLALSKKVYVGKSNVLNVLIIR